MSPVILSDRSDVTKVAPRMPRFADNAGVVAAAGEDERDVGIGRQLDFEYRSPRRDMIFFGRHHKQRRADVAQHDRLAIDLIAAFEQIVVEEQASQVFAVHAVGHAGPVGIPRHQVDHRPALAHQVLLHHLRPDQVVRLQQLEGTGHLLGVQITLIPHDVFQEVELAIVDK